MKRAKMVIVLTVICGVAAGLLQAVAAYTAPIIADEERAFELRAVNKAIQSVGKDPCVDRSPAFDNHPDEDVVCVDGVRVYRGRKDGAVSGVAFEATGHNAYSGTIGVLVGMNPQGTLIGLEILKHAETPGLGSGIEKCAWRRQFWGKTLSSQTWKVLKDGGDVDQISGATISSRAIINAIAGPEGAFAFFEKHRKAILEGPAMNPGEACHGD